MRASSDKLKRAMRARGLTDADLARVVNLKLRSWINIRNGSVQSHRAQQEATNCLQTKIWPDIEVTERIVLLPAGSIIALPSDDAGTKFQNEAGAPGDTYEIRQSIVKILVDSKIQLALSNTPDGSASH